VILVTVGASNLPFDRLVEAADDIATGSESVVVQYGAARVRPQRATGFDYVSYVELKAWVSNARLVVCHAGIGSVALCLSLGRQPVVVPRRKGLRECVDEHQLSFGRRLDELGLATTVEDVSELGDVVRSARTSRQATGLSPLLARELITYIGTHAAAGGRERRRRRVLVGSKWP
jgi:UDP-N-acetylglucosamine transferase subunit ALG13